jgi:hypothetical protein
MWYEPERGARFQRGVSLSVVAWRPISGGLIIARMVINMDEPRLRTVEQLAEFSGRDSDHRLRSKIFATSRESLSGFSCSFFRSSSDD